MKKTLLTLAILFLAFNSSVSAEDWQLLNKVPFTVEHYLIKADGTYSTEPDETEILYDYPGTPWNIRYKWTNRDYYPMKHFSAKSFLGFEYEDYDPAFIAEDGSTIIRVFYNSKIEYSFEWDNWADAPDNPEEIREVTVSIYEDLELPVPVREGYVFKGWNVLVWEAGRHDACYHNTPFFWGRTSVSVKEAEEFLESLYKPMQEFWDYAFSPTHRFVPEWEKAYGGR